MGPRAVRAVYAATAFLAAWLLFQMQPMLGKRLLPWFGGSPSTWTICMLFFQLGLLAGYAFADASIRRCSARVQLGLELLLLALALLVLPLGPLATDRPVVAAGGEVVQILSLLGRHAALPYLALATTAPLLQHWYERASGRSPYRLYAFSNAGSLAGLLGYPFAIEPWLGGARQSELWSALFMVFAACMTLTGALALRAGSSEEAAAPARGAATQRVSPLRWWALGAVPSAMLLAVTDHITVDVAAVPFLWIAPLALYLLSFVITFGPARPRRHAFVIPAHVLCTIAFGVGLLPPGGGSFLRQLAAALACLFSCCLLCHGELARSRPDPALLSRFYLHVAGGGAAGGAFVALLAPLLFEGLFELQLAVLSSYALLLWPLRVPPALGLARFERRWLWLGVGLAAPLLAASVWAQQQDHTRTGRVIERRRSFYGALRVTEVGPLRLLSHGRIRHGMQALAPERAGLPTAYFAPDSGVGRALRLHRQGHPRRIGVLGLGVGTLAAYGRPGDALRFYELSPDVVALAEKHFDFLRRSAAAIQIVLGDGRVALDREPSQRFDLLVLDAFASDAVPMHLLTVEAFGIYLRHLRPDGLLLSNVSNRHVDVDRVVAGSAAGHGLALRLVETPSDADHWYTRARWAVLARDPAAIERCLAGAPRAALPGPAVTWTDDFGNLLHVLR